MKFGFEVHKTVAMPGGFGYEENFLMRLKRSQIRGKV